MQFHMVTEAGLMVRNKQLCYVFTRVDKIYMSRQGHQQLGIIRQNFPLPDSPKVSSITDPAPGCDYGCPTRPSSPPPPIMFPSHLAWDMARLKEYLLHHYGSTVFTVGGEAPVTAAVTPSPKRGARPCRGCDGPDHGRRSQRLSDCPAKDVICERCSVKGHYTRKCIKCKDCQQWGHGSGKSKHCKSA